MSEIEFNSHGMNCDGYIQWGILGGLCYSTLQSIVQEWEWPLHSGWTRPERFVYVFKKLWYKVAT